MASSSQALRDMPSERQSRDALGLRNSYVAPETDRERTVARIWCEAFNLDRVGVDDNFFDLGGDSMIATTIAVAVSDELEIHFKPALVSECNTVRQIAAIGENVGSAAPPPTNVVACRVGGARPPVFFVHGKLGISFLRPGFLSGFQDDQPVYAFQVPGYDGTEEPLNSVEEIAENYLNGMLSVCPSGPWFIAAFCVGTWIASEMTKQMIGRGLRPDRVILLDPLMVPRRHTPRIMEKIKLATYYSRIRRRELSSVLQRRLDEPAAGERSARLVEEMTRVFEAPGAARASAILHMANRRYRPGVLEFPVDIVLSREQATDPNSPIKRLLPRHRIIVSGESHYETISAGMPTNARIIQDLVDQSLGQA